MQRALLATLMCFVAVSHGSLQTRSASDGPWSGWVRCELSAQLNEQGRSYLNQQTHTWELTASTPTSGTDIKEYPATWTVVGGGTGQRQEGNGRTVADKWNTSGQPMSTTISFRVDLTGALFIALRGAQLASVGAMTGQSVAHSTNGNAPDQQTSVRLNVDEYRFPLIRDDATKTSITGSTGPVTIGNMAPGQPPRTVATAACSWNFVRGGGTPPPPPSGRSITRDQVAPLSPVSGLSVPGTAPTTPSTPIVPGVVGGRERIGTATPPPVLPPPPPGTSAGPNTPPPGVATPTPPPGVAVLPVGTVTDPVRPTGVLAASGTWAGWMRCTLTTTGSNMYSDVQTQTWTLTGGAGTLADATTAVYPATWSVSGSGSSDKYIGLGPGSPPEGDHDYAGWDVNATGIAAPLAIGLRTSDARITFSSAHAPLRAVATYTKYSNYGTQQASTGQAPVVEMPLPVVADTATSVRVVGSSTPVVSGFSAPMQPADARTTASCSWSFDSNPLTADAPPPPPTPKTRAPLPADIAQRLLDLQKVKVLSPNGSEDWAMNTARTVIWEHKLGVGKRFDIDLSVDGGSAWVSLARNVADDGSGSRGAYDVMMPRYGSVAALIRVSPAGDIPNGDVSDGGFTLQDAWLRVDAPNGETVRFGGSTNFRVYTNLASDRYTIEISYNNGQNWDRLADSAPSGSTFVVPRTSQTNNGFAQVRATSHTVPTLRALGSLRVVY